MARSGTDLKMAKLKAEDESRMYFGYKVRSAACISSIMNYCSCEEYRQNMYNWENVVAHADIVALILASQFGCLEEMLIVVLMLSVESIFYVLREKLEEIEEVDTEVFASGTMIHFAREEMYLSRGDKSFIAIHDEAVIQSGITKKRVFYAVIAGLLLSWAKEATLAEVVLVKMKEEEILTMKADILEEIDVLDKKLLLCLKYAWIWML
ncbi:hypothetical protein Tco_1045399 [Tanacetum coccineum]|uniref:Uncharacterized protein n=1 Tax=Tanacetum coccineum TaxID=301880 RepID=A0ABQ5GTN3_9ASTR